MLLSFTRIGPGGFPDVAVSQLIYELRCLLVFATLFTLLLNPGPQGTMSHIRYILYGISAVMALETLIVCMEYIGAIPPGPLFMGIRVDSFREGLGMGEALRVGGTFRHPNYLVVFSGASFLLLWQAEMDSHPEVRRSVLHWPGIIGGFLCMILTLSRSGWAGTAAGGMFYVFVMLAGRGYPWIRSLPWKYVLPALIVIFAVGLFFSGAMINKLFYSDSGNVSSRYYTNDMAMMIAMDNPWLGVGLGQHGFSMATMSRFAELRSALKTFPSVHNSYLLILTEIGIIGTTLYFLVPFYALFHAMMTCLRNPNHRATAVLSGACSAVIIYLVADLASISLRHFNLSIFFWFLLGIVLGLSEIGRAHV
jgi:O-antigen ligase